MTQETENVTILVVEDDVNVRQLAVDMFEAEDFLVHQASDAKTGLELFNAHPEIDLVFSDLILPGGVTGIEMTKKILELNAEALIILATGYQDKGEAIAANTQSMENIVYIPKPYDVEEIPVMVKSMIAEKKGAGSSKE